MVRVRVESRHPAGLAVGEGETVTAAVHDAACQLGLSPGRALLHYKSGSRRAYTWAWGYRGAARSEFSVEVLTLRAGR